MTGAAVIILDVILDHPSSDSELRESHIVKRLGSSFGVLVGFLEAFRTNRHAIKLDFFVDALNSPSPNFAGFSGALHFLVCPHVNSVTLVVPPASLVDGLEGSDGASELAPNRFV